MKKPKLSREFLDKLSPEEKAFIISWDDLYSDEEFQISLLGLKLKELAKGNLLDFDKHPSRKSLSAKDLASVKTTVSVSMLGQNDVVRRMIKMIKIAENENNEYIQGKRKSALPSFDVTFHDLPQNELITQGAA